MSIARHTAYNLVGALLPVAVSLVTVPLYLKFVGLERYGILNLCWLLVGYFNFFDFGLGRGTAQQLAALQDSGSTDRSRAFWTGIILSLALAAVATIIALPITWFALGWFKLGSPALRAETLVAVPLLITAIPVAILQSVLKGSLEGRQHFLTVNVVFGSGAIATGILPLVATAIWGPTIILLVAVSLGVRLIVLIALAIAAIDAVPVLRFQRPHRSDAHKVLRFGAWLTITNLVGPMMVFFDRFLIGAVIGAAAVALYVIPFNLINQLVVLPASLSVAMFPRLAALRHSEQLKRDALHAATFLMTPITIAGAILLEPFLRLWLGSAKAGQSLPIAIVLMVGAWANGLAQLPYTSLQARGRTDLTAKAHLAELLPYFMLLWIGLKYFGVVGAAIAWSTRAVIDFFLLSILDGIGGRVMRRATIQGAAVLLLCGTLLAVPPPSPLRWGLVVTISLATMTYLIKTIPAGLVEKVRNSLQRALLPNTLLQ